MQVQVVAVLGWKKGNSHSKSQKEIKVDII